MKKLIIFSFHGDRSTNRLIDWLVHFNCPYLRINLEDECVSKIFIDFKNITSQIGIHLNNGETVVFNSNTICFIRGGYFKSPEFVMPEIDIDKKSLINHLYDEFESMEQYFYKTVNELSICGVFEMPEHNKIFQLKNAQNIGFKIPNTKITSQKKYLINVFDKARFLVIKGIQNNLVAAETEHQSIQRAEKIAVSEIPKHFFPCAFQEIIKKDYEVRVFYFGGKFYAIKIQESTMNKEIIDMRDKYSSSYFCQYLLSEHTQNKIIELLSALNVKSASLDLLKQNNDYVFLEVNYTGQYDWVSKYGNFDIHRDIGVYIKSILN
jgi:hypothetical protein